MFADDSGSIPSSAAAEMANLEAKYSSPLLSRVEPSFDCYNANVSELDGWILSAILCALSSDQVHLFLQSCRNESQDAQQRHHRDIARLKTQTV